MRPDVTCETGEAGSRGTGTPKDIPCKFSYQENSTYKCQFRDIIQAGWAENKTPRDLINEGVLTRDQLQSFVFWCIRFVRTVVGSFYTDCARCGECCRYWTIKKYATYSDQPCKPPNWQGRGNPENPCIHLEIEDPGPPVVYRCPFYGTVDMPEKCLDYPTGTEVDLFEQLLDWDGGPIAIDRTTSCPSCVFRFGREV